MMLSPFFWRLAGIFDESGNYDQATAINIEER